MERQKRRVKSQAKMAGVKSTFVIGDELLMTSFGDRDEAVSEKNINIIGVVENLHTPETYSVEYTDSEDIKVAKSASNIKATLKSPFFDVQKNAKSPEGEAYRRRVAEHRAKQKAEYEKLVFGNTYDDNIHIQLVSKILDIEKNFSIVMGNLSYAINNLSNEQDIENPVDYLGQGDVRSDDERIRRILPRYSYLYGYGIKPYHTLSHDDAKELKKDEIEAIKEKNAIKNEEIYYANISSLKSVLSVLSVFRIDTFHGIDSKNDDHVTKLPVVKYNLDKKKDANFEQRVTAPLQQKLNDVKSDYLKNSVVNIKLLEHVLDLVEAPRKKRNVTKEYFDFAILKSYKNLGFSLKALREEMLKLYEMNFESKLNLRQRMNSFCDYLLYDYFVNLHPEEAVRLVESLRASANDEQKEEIYRRKAASLGKRYRNAFNSIAEFEAKDIKQLKKSELPALQKVTFPFEDRARFGNVDLKVRKKSDLFCAMAYYITLFLDGKEINIFLTTLVNIFENISSFMDVMKRHAIECRFTDDFCMFGDSVYIAEKLKTVISLARMKKSLDVCNSDALSDAIIVLGTSITHRDLDMKSYMEMYLFGGKDESEQLTEHDRNLRNFLTTNVIKSRKFNYISRYCNLETVKRFANNRTLVELVLRRINDPKLIDRYYSLINPGRLEEKSYKDKLSSLASVIIGMNIDNLEDVNNAEVFSGKATKKSVMDRNVLRACVGLYLNALYQIAKNLMNVNGRYVLAFAMTERDSLMEGLDFVDSNSKANNIDYIALTKYYLNNGLVKCATDRIRENIKKYGGDETKLLSIPGEVIRKNLNGYCPGSEIVFRNSVAHMTMMARAPIYAENIANVNSYYELYHYCMQCHIVWCQEKFGKAAGTQKMKESLEAAMLHHTYSKDAVKILCLPFAYNYARYKALSVNELFDWTDYNRGK